MPAPTTLWRSACSMPYCPARRTTPYQGVMVRSIYLGTQNSELGVMSHSSWQYSSFVVRKSKMDASIFLILQKTDQVDNTCCNTQLSLNGDKGVCHIKQELRAVEVPLTFQFKGTILILYIKP